MHVIINGNFLSLDNILILTAINNDPAGNWFVIRYMNGQEIYFYHREQAPEDITLHYRAFYFKNIATLEMHRTLILNLFIDAAEFNTAG